MGDFVKVAQKSDIPQDGGKCVELEDRQIAIFQVDGEYYAIDNICPHQGGPLDEGDLDDTTVTCPWHGWEYNVTNGENLDDPDVKQDTYAVKVDGDDILVEV